MKLIDKLADDNWSTAKSSVGSATGLDVDSIMEEKPTLMEQLYSKPEQSPVYNQQPDVVDKLVHGSNADAYESKGESALIEDTETQDDRPKDNKPAWYQGLDFNGFKLPEDTELRSGSVSTGRINAATPKWISDPSQVAVRTQDITSSPLARNMNTRRLRNLNISGWS